MYTKYESAFYYKNPEIQLVINLQRIKDELGALLHIDHCDCCMGLKCKCLDVATVADTGDISVSSPLANTTEQKDRSTKAKDVCTKTKDASTKTNARTVAWREDAKDTSSIPWTNVATKNIRTTSWTKETKDVSTNAKWSFKFSPLNIEEEIWRRADRYRRLEEKYLSSETVEEFFLSLRKGAVKCS